MATVFVDLGNVDNTRTFGDDDYVVIGEDGNNTLTFGDGDDQLTLGDGNNTLTLGGGTNSIVAGEGNNTVTIKGTGASAITLADGNNTITVADGPSVIRAGNGLNTITTGDGNSQVFVGNGVNDITTGDGNSRIVVGNGDANGVTVGLGSNRIALGSGSGNTVSTGAGDNLLYVSAAALGTDSIMGALTSGDGHGNTVLVTSSGTIGTLGVSGFEVFALADDGQNSLTLTNANFVRLPGGVITVLGGDAGNVVTASGLGATHAVLVVAGEGVDVMRGGLGIDTVSYTASAAAVMVNLATQKVAGGDAAGDRIAGFENAVGGAGHDRLFGSAGNNRLDGGTGNDLLAGNAGNDVLAGGDGADVLDGGLGADRMYGGRGNDVFIVDAGNDRAYEEFASGGIDLVEASVTFALSDNVENLTLTGTAARGYGNNLNNRLVGNAGANLLSGSDGNDIIIGGDGGDRILGGRGADRLAGGTGRDAFYFDTALSAGNVDVITDFAPGQDLLVLSATVFTTLSPGDLPADAFINAISPADAEDRIIYNGTSGGLFYDADGTGAGSALRFATLASGLALTASDIVIIA